MLTLAIVVVSIWSGGMWFRSAWLNDQVVAAVKRGDEARVRGLLGQGARASSRDYVGVPFVSRGVPVVILAASQGDAEIVRALVANGATSKELDFQGHTALSWAAFGGHVRAVGVLLDAGADPNDG